MSTRTIGAFSHELNWRLPVRSLLLLIILIDCYNENVLIPWIDWRAVRVFDGLDGLALQLVDKLENLLGCAQLRGATEDQEKLLGYELLVGHPPDPRTVRLNPEHPCCALVENLRERTVALVS
jgi:hypothetical protein